MDLTRSDALRPICVERGFTPRTAGSVLYTAGETMVLCTASLVEGVPSWRAGSGKGWLTAEYSMLPHSTRPRKGRERGTKLDGRTTEIQRLIGRALRSVARLDLLGERTLMIDCDVLQADGGTRTAAITGALVAVVDALAERFGECSPEAYPLRDSLAAVSVGLIDGQPMIDLDYAMDAAAEVDMNVVMTASGRFVEIQGGGEEATFDSEQLGELLELARRGISGLIAVQQDALGELWPFAFQAQPIEDANEADDEDADDDDDDDDDDWDLDQEAR